MIDVDGRMVDLVLILCTGWTKLYFSSTRPLHGNDSTPDYNIWFVEKLNGEWSADAKPVSIEKAGTRF